MYKLPYLWFGVVSSLAGVCNSSPVGEDCTTDSQVVVELQPWKFICSGVTSSSTKTRTYTVPPCPEPTGPPGKPGQPTTVTVTEGCPEGGSCNPGTITPGPDCSGICTVTVITTSSVPPVIPTTTTVTTGCAVDDSDCRPTTLPPAPGCTQCTATVITTPPPTSAPPNTAPPTTRTITTGCPADKTSSCVPTTIPPPPGCTACTATVITTPPVTSAPSSTAPPNTRTITTGCPADETSSCVPTTIPPPSGCTACTATVITTPPVTSSPPTSEPPGTTTTVTTVCLADDPDCRATTIPPPSTCTGTSTCTATVITISTPTPTPTSSEPSSTSSEPPSPTFSCDAGGYLIQRRSLYRLNLETGANPLVSSDVGPSGGTNAIGYNVLDNYIWGVSQLAENWQLIRIDSDGGWKVYDTYIDTEAGWQNGDVGPDGHLYLWSANGAWREIDVNPDSDTYLQEVGRGVSPLNGPGSVADWVYVEGGGRYLYSVQGYQGTSSTLVRWSMDTHQWERVRGFGDVAGLQQWGALYAVGDRFYGSENNSGEIWSFPINSAGAAPAFVTDGPISGANDGARCALAPAPSAGN